MRGRPNTDSNGKPSDAAGVAAGAVGYDDMACGDGKKCGGIFNFGTWVNGGVWTTTVRNHTLGFSRYHVITFSRCTCVYPELALAMNDQEFFQVETNLVSGLSFCLIGRKGAG
jgi:hypothetical protein